MNKLLRIDPKVIRVVLVLVVLSLLLSGCVSTESYSLPADEGGIISKIFVYPIAWLLFHITEFMGGNLAIGIIITTLLIRTIAWPIYAKGSNSMAQQQEVQPEIQRIQAKYAGKTDTASQQRMSAEIRNVYKENNVNFLGCLFPFLQMPIFLAVYNAIIRFPNNLVAGTNTIDFAGKTMEIDTNLFGIDILKTVIEGFQEGKYIYLVMPLLVAGSMFLHQKATQSRTKNQTSDIPEYRRNTQADSMQKQMKFFMYGTVVMMAAFSVTAPSLLAMYWTVGNFYSLLQTTITYKSRDRKRVKKA